jgi:hypothetical protein
MIFRPTGFSGTGGETLGGIRCSMQIWSKTQLCLRTTLECGLQVRWHVAITSYLCGSMIVRVCISQHNHGKQTADYPDRGTHMSRVCQHGFGRNNGKGPPTKMQWTDDLDGTQNGRAVHLQWTESGYVETAGPGKETKNYLRL